MGEQPVREGWFSLRASFVADGGSMVVDTEPHWSRWLLFEPWDGPRIESDPSERDGPLR